MKITILTDNIASGQYLAEHGLSYLIEHDHKTILFDTGHSDVFIKNAAQMEIDLQQEVDLIVLSHGHWDHGGGLRFIKDKPLLTHPASFMKRYNRFNTNFNGLQISKDDAEQQFELILSERPYQISNKIIFLGEIPRRNTFESQTTSFMDEDGYDDYIPDDSAIVFINQDQLIIISGCAHSGICNICEYAKKLTAIESIQAVFGGFHLKKNNQQTKETIRYFKENQISQVYPSHCTELPALSAFHTELKSKAVKTGFKYIF